jgi:hypothetical protein
MLFLVVQREPMLEGQGEHVASASPFWLLWIPPSLVQLGDS